MALALLFFISGIALALCANVLRRTLQTRFAPGAAVVVTSLAAIPTLWLGVVAIAGVAVALAVTITVFRVAAKRDDAALERLQGALIGLGAFEGMVLVAAIAGVYFMRSAPL